jgi:hypothetical protein
MQVWKKDSGVEIFELGGGWADLEEDNG